MTLPAFQLIPTATATAAQFSLGHPFKRGDVPAGSVVLAPFPDFQCSVISTWPDGSAKTTILAGLADLVANTTRSIQLSVGAAPGGTNLTTAAIKALSAVAVVDCGTYGSVTWLGTDWDATFDTVCVGPKMSSWRYRKPIPGDAHLVAWLEVRVWSNGTLCMEPWIENGYWMVPSPSNRLATFAFTLGGTQRYSGTLDIKHHCTPVLMDGVKLTHWLGADPGCTPFHDQAYFMATEVTPTYGGTSPAYDSSKPYQANAGHSYLASTFTPLQPGNIAYDSDDMPGTGYQGCIGLLPIYDVAYLYCTTRPDLLYGAVVRAGYVPGRYGIHFRDENTNRPVLLSAYPTMGLTGGNDHGITGVGSCTGGYTPEPTGGEPPRWDISHSPSIGYMASLITGRRFFIDQAQFAVVANHYSTTDWVRGGGVNDNGYQPAAGFTGASGICNSMRQTRCGAWWFRSVAQALAITPDSGDPFRAGLINCIKDNIRYFKTVPISPFGYIKFGDTEVYTDVATDRRMVPGWQYDFRLAAFGHALCLGLPITAQEQADLLAHFKASAYSVVARCGTAASGYRYEKAATYEIAMSPSTLPDMTLGSSTPGPWYANDAAVYAATMVGKQSPAPTDGALYYFESDYGPAHLGVWANMIPALAYAVRHGVTGADTAWSRITGASNFSTMKNGFALESPVGDVVPSGQTSTTGGTLITPGPSFIWDSASLVANSFVWDTYRGLGMPLSAIPSGGTNGTSIIRALIESTDNANSEARVRYISTPTGFLSGGDTSYTSPEGAIEYEVYLDGGLLGLATDTITSSSGTVTGVSISPPAPTVAGSGTVQLTATVAGSGSPSQAVTWSKVSGVGAVVAGLVSMPAAISSAQTGVFRATSVQDSSKYANVTVTVAALTGPPAGTATRVHFVLEAPGSVLVKNATNIHFAFFAQSALEALQAPVYQGSTLATDGSAVLDFSIAGLTSMNIGDIGTLALSNADFTFTALGPVAVQ